MGGAQHFELQPAKLAVTNEQEISVATGWVKKRQTSQLFIKLEQPVPVAFDLAKLGPQLVQKQWLDEL